jgi:hypothetical protein
MTPIKKLIEVALPLDATNREAAEKIADRHPHSGEFHLLIDPTVAGSSLTDGDRRMTPTQPSCPYRDFALNSGDVGYPELCNLPNGNLLASTEADIVSR